MGGEVRNLQDLFPEGCALGQRAWRRKPKGVGGGVSGAPGLSKDVQETALFLLSERQTAVLRSCPGKNAQITRGIMVHPQHSV